MQLLLTSPMTILPEENLFKFLLPGSRLYHFLFNLKMELIQNNFVVIEDQLDFHIQIINKRAERLPSTMRDSSLEIEGCNIDIYDRRNYGIIDNSIVLLTPSPHCLWITRSHVKIATLENKKYNLQKSFLFLMDRIEKLVPLN